MLKEHLVITILIIIHYICILFYSLQGFSFAFLSACTLHKNHEMLGFIYHVNIYWIAFICHAVDRVCRQLFRLRLFILEEISSKETLGRENRSLRWKYCFHDLFCIHHLRSRKSSDVPKFAQLVNGLCIGPILLNSNLKFLKVYKMYLYNSSVNNNFCLHIFIHFS